MLYLITSYLVFFFYLIIQDAIRVNIEDVNKETYKSIENIKDTSKCS